MDKFTVQPVNFHRFPENRCYALKLTLLLTTQFSMNVAGFGPALFCLAVDGIFNDQTGAVSLCLIEKKCQALGFFALLYGFEEQSASATRTNCTRSIICTSY